MPAASRPKRRLPAHVRGINWSVEEEPRSTAGSVDLSRPVRLRRAVTNPLPPALFDTADQDSSNQRLRTSQEVTLSMSEAQLQDAVIELCRRLSVLVCHFRPARTASSWRTALSGDKGFPDVVCAGERGTIFRELKSESGRLTAEQSEWLARLGGDVWRPSDWTSGRIEHELRHIARVTR